MRHGSVSPNHHKADPRRSGSKKEAWNCIVLWPRLTCLVSVLVSRPATRADVSGKASSVIFTCFLILAKWRKFSSVLWIRGSGSSFFLYLNSDPNLDSGSQTNADPCGSKPGLFVNFVLISMLPDPDPQQSNQCESIRIRIHNTGLVRLILR